MTVIAVTMVRDEADIIGHTVANLLAYGVDQIIAADNLSRDDTPDILNAFDQVTVVADDEPGYYQAEKMTRLAQHAADLGATWVLPFDADELWYPTSHPTIPEALAAAAGDIVAAPGWDHIATPNDPDRWCPFRQHPHRRANTQQMPKVAFRAHPAATLHMGNHDVDHPGQRTSGVLAYRHYQYRSLEQMRRKLRNGRQAYEAGDIHPMHGTHWREGGALTDEQLADRWDGLLHTPNLVHDPAPARCCP